MNLNINNFISTVAPWMVTSFPIIRIVLIALLGVCAIALVVCIFLQPAAADGSGALTGQASDTYYSKNKGSNFEGIMKRVSIGISIAIAVIAILFFVTLRLYPVTI